MKNKYVIYACMFILGICMNACGSSKQKKSSMQAYGKPVALEPCMAYADESPATRAWGNGEHFKLSTAKNLAEGQARSTFAKAIATAVTAALRMGRLSVVVVSRIKAGSARLDKRPMNKLRG